MTDMVKFVPMVIWYAIVEAKGIGIIYIEEQLIQWLYACVSVAFMHYMPTIIMVVALYAMVMYAFGARPFHHHGPHHGLHRLWHTILGFIFTIGFAWGFLIFGAVAGNLYDPNHADPSEAAGRVTYNYRRPIGHFWFVTYSFARLSLHYRLGRGLFRMFFRIVRWAAGRFGWNISEAWMIRISRVLALVVILWGVWCIPYDLTH